MSIFDAIREAYRNRRTENHTISKGGELKPYNLKLDVQPFGRTIYLNAVELLTDLYNEVTWQVADTPLAMAWRTYVYRNGLRLLEQLLSRQRGYIVIAWAGDAAFGYTFRELREDEYEVVTESDVTWVRAKDKMLNYYVLKDPTFEALNISTFTLCKPYISYLDHVLSGSDGVSKRLGTVVFMSPQNDPKGAMETVLEPEEKEEIEKELSKRYGAMEHQSVVSILKKPMQLQTVNLAGIDQRTRDKVELAVKVICDRLKVPANQVALINSSTGTTMANGTEMREGELQKYRSFRRLLNATLYDFATEIGLKVDYTIENEPLTQQGNNIQQA